jgi:hypothetical protein
MYICKQAVEKKPATFYKTKIDEERIKVPSEI